MTRISPGSEAERTDRNKATCNVAANTTLQIIDNDKVYSLWPDVQWFDATAAENYPMCKAVPSKWSYGYHCKMSRLQLWIVLALWLQLYNCLWLKLIIALQQHPWFPKGSGMVTTTSCWGHSYKLPYSFGYNWRITIISSQNQTISAVVWDWHIHQIDDILWLELRPFSTSSYINDRIICMGFMYFWACHMEKSTILGCF